MIDVSKLSGDALRAALFDMASGGDVPVLAGMRIQTCGGTGSICTGGSGVLFEGRELAVIGATYRGQCVHGCVACPHEVLGNFITGSQSYVADGIPLLTVGSMGVHTACCGANTGLCVEGIPIAELM